MDYTNLFFISHLHELSPQLRIGLSTTTKKLPGLDALRR